MKIPDGFVFITHSNRKATSVEFEHLELVMCRSCENCMPNADGSHHCRIHGGYVEKDDWCSWAEKKESEDDA